MSEHRIAPASLMPKWWRVATTTLLYAAYLLWLVPIVLYVQGDADLLTALMWFAGVVVVQFVLVKVIAFTEYVTTANEIERLNDIEEAQAQLGDKQ
ncbi:hypothetical protein [uncultured Sulfitobacter sp.]|uniref:hypothetical protein n=1 Tax=uncultured Sulfitobacter sp. TaxID=191468 RepID=UPI00260164B6|nr:hypothetical protein [uncultured Sulfitobacter sp.]